MNTVESLGYLKGLLEGLDLDDNKKETKVFKAIIDVLENITDDVDDIYEEIGTVEEQLDAIDEDLAEVECYLEDDDCDCGCDCDCDDECDYELECPVCGEAIIVNEETIDEGGIECPACGEYLEFDFDCDCCEEEE